jgi:hypothetical protein
VWLALRFVALCIAYICSATSAFIVVCTVPNLRGSSTWVWHMPARRALCSTLSLRPWCSCVCVSTTLAPVWCVRAWGSQRVYSKDACHISSSLRAARSLVRRIATDSNWWRDQNRTHQKDIFELRSTNAAALLITVVRHMQLVDARLMAQQHSAAAVQSTARVKEWNHQPAISQRGVLVHRQPGQSWCIPLV